MTKHSSQTHFSINIFIFPSSQLLFSQDDQQNELNHIASNTASNQNAMTITRSLTMQEKPGNKNSQTVFVNYF